MFLITPDFTCRLVDVVKLIPMTGMNKEQYGHESGTLVYINNLTEHRVDKEFTSMAYVEVLEALDNAR